MPLNWELYFREVFEMSDVKGSCHCGTVQWEFSLPITTVVKCHCGNCRKLQGSDYATCVVVPAVQYKVVGGSDSVTEYKTEISSKSFCSVCGSPSFLINGNHPTDVIVALGSIDTYIEELAPQIQVYTPDKAIWLNLHDDEPIFS